MATASTSSAPTSVADSRPLHHQPLQTFEIDNASLSSSQTSVSSLNQRQHPHQQPLQQQPSSGLQGQSASFVPSEHTIYRNGDNDNGDLIDPHAIGNVGGDIPSAILGIIKAMVGPAILYLPHGFVAAGWVAALPILAISTFLYLHSSQCLLEVWKHESQKQLVPTSEDEANHDLELEESMDNTQLQLQEALHKPRPDDHQERKGNHNSHARHQKHKSLSYPTLAARAFGPKGETLVQVGIALMQSGVCLTYLIFVPHNLHVSLQSLLGWNCSTNFWLVCMLLMQIPLSWIKDIRKFTCTNAMANGLILYGLLLCLWFALIESSTTTYFGRRIITRQLKEYVPPEETNSSVKNVWEHFVHLSPFGDHWILFIGTAVLLFEGSITLLLPLQEACESVIKPGQILTERQRFPLVYPKVILGIQCFYVIFATTCWMSFGNDVNVVLTTSLPEGFLATTVQLAYSVAVLFTFPLQNYPALEIVEHAAQQWPQQVWYQTYVPPNWQSTLHQRHVLSGIIVIFLGMVAWATMDALDKVVSLTGALIGIPIAFMIPPLIHTQLMPNLEARDVQKNYGTALLGLCAMVIASTTTIWEWNDK